MNTDKIEQQLTPTTERPTEEGWYWWENEDGPLEPRWFHIEYDGLNLYIPRQFNEGNWAGPIDLAELLEVVKDTQYALDRLALKEDQGPGLRVLIDAATNRGDYFPSCELQRRKEQFADLNQALAGQLEFSDELVKEVDRLTAKLSTMSTLLLKASIKFQAAGDLFTTDGSPTLGDYCRALAKDWEQAATAEKGKQ